MCFIMKVLCNNMQTIIDVYDYRGMGHHNYRYKIVHIYVVYPILILYILTNVKMCLHCIVSLQEQAFKAPLDTVISPPRRL